VGVVVLAAAACGGGGDGPSTPQIARIQVDPATATIDVNTTTQFVGTPVDKDGNVVVNSTLSITWQSLTPAVATIDAAGLATGVAQGTATIEATGGSFKGTATLTVLRPPVGSLRIEPGNVSLFRGDTQQLQARVFTDASLEVTDRAVAWRSGNEQIATITATGRTATLTARAPGATTITATSEQVSAEVSIVVGADGIIALSVETVDLSVARLSADPAVVDVQVSNVGGGVLRGLSAIIAHTAGQPTGWLVAQLSATGSPATLTLQGRAQSLAEGVYTASVTIRSTTQGVAEKVLSVRLTVGPGPSIVVSAAAVTLNTFAGGPTPAAQGVTVTNGGGAVLSGLALGAPTYGPGANGWLQAQLAGTTAPTALSIGANTTTLAAGTYTASLPVTSSLPGVTSRTVAVTLVVAPAPIIALTPPAVTFTGAVNGAAPGPQVVTVDNVGGGVLDGLSLGTTTYGAGANGWLTATLSASQAPATVTLTPSLTGLTAGQYTATVPVRSSISTVAAQSIAVTLNVSAGQVITLSTSSIAITATQGGLNPTNRLVTVTNGGTGILSGLSLGPITFTGGAAGFMTATISAAVAPATVTLAFPTVSGLAVGNYTARLEVRSSIPGVSPATINVALTVNSGAVITLGSATATFSALSGGSNPAPQSITVTNGGTGALTALSVSAVTYTAGPTVGWLAVALASTTAPTTLILTPTTASLAAGSYAAQFDVRSTLLGVASRTVVVNLTVTPSTTIGLSTTNVTMNAPNGGGNPTNVNVSVTNTGANPLTGLTRQITYITAAPTQWLAATLSSTTAPSVLTLSASVTSLASGSYTARVDVLSPVALNSPRAITVTLVIPPPTIALGNSSPAFVVTQSTGAVLTAPPAVSITNSGGGILSGITRSVTCAAGWLTTSLSSTTAPATLSVGINTGAAAALVRGNHACTITINAPGATNTPRFVTVSLTAVFTYNTHVASIWTTSSGGQTCASGSCHGPFNPNLSTGDIYTRLTTTNGTGGIRYITPNNTGASLLYTRVNSTSSPMPTSGRNATFANTIRDWINDGALRP